MYEIIPNLYLSAYHAVQVTADTFVVNCTKDLPMRSVAGTRVAVDDDGSREAMYGMLLALPGVVEQIDQQLKSGKRVVVHCLAGQQRSPTVVAAYLVGKCSYNLKDAISYIREKKKDAFFWSVNFRDSLEQYVMMKGHKN